MEKVISNEKSTKALSESLILQNRSNLKLEGIVEVLSTSDTCFNLKLKDTTLTITGENLNISKLDINAGLLEADGNFTSIKYGKGTGGFLKRIFKWKLVIFYN